MKSQRKSAAKNKASKSPKKWYKTEWDFSVLYSGIDDPKLDKDVSKIEAAYLGFAKKYGGKTDYLNGGAHLVSALDDWERLNIAIEGWKPHYYLGNLKNLDSQNEKLSAKEGVVVERLVKASNSILFFELGLGRVSADKQKKWLKDPSLKRFHRFLEKTFAKSRYMLSEAEERIINLKQKAAYDAWVDAQQKLATSQTVKFKGKEINLTRAYYLRFELPPKERRQLNVLVGAKLKSISHMAEAEMNAIISDKKTEDELRGAKKPYELTVIGYDNDIPTVERLVDLVSANFDIVHEYYKLKASVLGLKKLSLPDLAAPLEKKPKRVSLDEAIETISAAFEKTDPEFKKFFHEMLKNGQIDFFPKAGKRGGAYCSSRASKTLPICIMMNYVNVTDSMTTLAHEMGHAIHSRLSLDKQPELYADYPISIAEVASTFFEHVLFHHMLESMTDKEKAYAMLSDIEDNVGTIFRQIQFFNFEKELHGTIKAKGAMSKEEMAALYIKHARIANGSTFEPSLDDGYYFTNVPHFRSYFYVYTYAYGQLISRALYAKYKKDPAFIEKVKEFLSAGGSRSPYDIFKSIGIDTANPEFFKTGIKSLREELETAKMLAKKAKIIK